VAVMVRAAEEKKRVQGVGLGSLKEVEINPDNERAGLGSLRDSGVNPKSWRTGLGSLKDETPEAG